MNILVTGASGFVGTALVRRICARGVDRVRVLVRHSSKRAHLEALGAEISYGDLLTGHGLDAAVRDVQVVFHLAGLTRARSEAEFHRGNAEGTRLLVSALARASVSPRLVHCSSLAAAGPSTHENPRDERTEPAPVSAYGRSKLAGEAAVRELAGRVPSVILRPPIVYGPGDTVNLPPLLAMARAGIFLKPGLRQRRFSFIHVEDLCHALELAAVRGGRVSPGELSSGVYFVSDPSIYTWDAFCTELAHALGLRARVVPLPEALAPVVGFAAECVGRASGRLPILNRDKAREMLAEAWTCNPARARAQLGFVPRWTSLPEGLADAVSWYRERGMLAQA